MSTAIHMIMLVPSHSEPFLACPLDPGARRCSQDPGTEVSCKAKDESMQRCVLRKNSDGGQVGELYFWLDWIILYAPASPGLPNLWYPLICHHTLHDGRRQVRKLPRPCGYGFGLIYGICIYETCNIHIYDIYIYDICFLIFDLQYITYDLSYIYTYIYNYIYIWLLYPIFIIYTIHMLQRCKHSLVCVEEPVQPLKTPSVTKIPNILETW